MGGNEETLQTDLIVKFLQRYYTVLPNKPQSWYDMVESLKAKETVKLLPI